MQTAVDLAVANQHHADAVLAGHGVVIGQGADFFQRRIFQVLGLINNDDLVRAVKPVPQGKHLVHLVPAFGHPQGAGQQLDAATQRAGTRRDADAHRIGGVVFQKLLGTLAFSNACIAVQNHHAVFQLGKTDALVNILADGSGHIRFPGQQPADLFGHSSYFIVDFEKLCQLPFHSLDRAFVLLVQVAAQSCAG